MPEPTDPKLDSELEHYLAGKSDISRRYREMSMESPSAELDEKIMHAARQELHQARPSPASRWMLPLSAVASVVLAVGVVLNLLRHEDISKLLPQEKAAVAPLSIPAGEGTAPAMEGTMQDTTQAPAMKKAEPAAGVMTGPDRDQASNFPPAPQSATGQDAAPRMVPETGAAPSAPIPASEEDAGQPPNNAAATMEEGDSERRESAPAAAMERSGIPKSGSASDTAGTTAGSADRPANAEESPEAWIERIRSLRIAGRDAEAQREFDAFHSRYPDYALPPDLEPGN